MVSHQSSLRLYLLGCSLVAAVMAQSPPIAEEQPPRALTPRGTAFLGAPNEHDFYGIGGITYDESTGYWTGIHEGNPGAGLQMKIEVPRIHVFDANFDDGTIDVISSWEVSPGDGLKTEGIARVPTTCGKNESIFSEEAEYWLVSESNSNTEATNSYFSKRFGHVDLNTFVPGSRRDSRFIRVSSTGKLLEEIQLPQWMLWDEVFDWDMEKCYGNRVLKGLHSLTRYEPKEGESAKSTQLIMMNQIALYQDGPEPTVFEGSHVRIMFWDVGGTAEGGDGSDSQSCSTPVSYSRSYRYQTMSLQIDTFQKGARHVRGVFGIMAISATEFLVTETELLEGFGIVKFISDVFYVKIESENDTVDHCDSLMDCDDVKPPIKRHLLRRDHPYEMSSLAWGPKVEKDGVILPTVAMSFEDDNVVGVLMELYTLNITHLEFEPVYENNKDSTAFIQQRVAVLASACAVFGIGLFLQFWFVSRQQRAKQAANARDEDQAVDERDASPKRRKLSYKDYVLASAVVNSCLLGGVVFGFVGLVLILRREGVYSEVCSCGVYCAGQQEKMAVISTMGFAAAIGSRLFAGVFLDKFGPKLTALCSGIVSTTGLIIIATAADVTQLSSRVAAAWIILAVGGSSMHLTSFHVTNLQGDPADKRKASLYVSAAFGAGSLVLPILQLINQYGGVSLQAICAAYSCVTILLTMNSFFVQPWRAWNALGSEAVMDLNFFRLSWWPSSIHELTAIKKSQDKKFPPLKEALQSFDFWGESFWFSCQLFLLTYYLSTISQILFALGDAKVNEDVDSLLNYMYTRACVFFNGLGWLWAPIVGYVMKNKSIYFRISLEIVMALVMSLLLTVPNIEVQVVVFLLQSLVRLQVFSNHFAYIGERFGFRHFGLLNGISSLVAGAFGLLGYMLQIFSVFIANGNYGLSYFIVAGLILSSSIFPILLKRKDQAKLAEADQVKLAEVESSASESKDGDIHKDLSPTARAGSSLADEEADTAIQVEGTPNEDK